MLRKLACAVAVLGLSLGLVAAEEFGGKITRIEGGKISVLVKKKGEKKAELKELTIAKDCKVCTMKKKEKVEVDGGLKAEVLANIDAKKGVNAKLVTNADNQVVEIIIAGAKKKKKKD